MSDDELRGKLNDLLQELDGSDAPATESEIRSLIQGLVADSAEVDIPFEVRAEGTAFGFCENCADSEGGRGTYFGPMAVFRAKDGSLVEVPSIEAVEPRHVEYWAGRSEVCNNPLLTARYCGLVWDLAKRVTGASPPHEIARRYVASLIKVSDEGRDRYDSGTVQKLKRAMEVALSLNDVGLVTTCKDAILRLEKRVADDGKAGLWGFSFDLLVGHKNIDLTADELKAIIDDLEGLLDRLCRESEGKMADPWTAKYAAERLAKYYRAAGRGPDVQRVLGRLREAVESVAKEASGLLAYSLLKEVYSAYRQFGLFEEAEAVSNRMREVGPAMVDEMREVAVKVEIPRDELDAYVEEITSGGAEAAVCGAVGAYIPDGDEIKERMLRQSKEFPLQYLIGSEVLDGRGRVIASVGSLENDLEGNTVRHVADDMRMRVPFLSAVMHRLVERYSLTADALLDFICQSPAFREDKRSILRRGLQAYLDGDHLVAVHLLVPQIEDAIREVLELLGGAVLKVGRGGGFHLRTLDDLLRDGLLAKMLGDDVTTYFRVLLTDQRGWNLRNDLCHGLLPGEAYGVALADRVIHVLLCLSLLRRREPES